MGRHSATDLMKSVESSLMTPSRSIITSLAPCCTPSASELLAQQIGELADADARLRAAVALANRDAAGAQRVAVDGDAERRTGLVLPTIPSADSALLVVVDVEAL